MVSPGTNGEKELTLLFPSLGSYPAFLRKITRKSHWDNALRDCDHQTASAVFVEEDNSTSVYLVHDDVELRRIAVAMNEYKKSKKEQVNLLAIRPSELKQIGVQPRQTPGAFSCHLAKGLHHDLELDQQAAIALSRVLIQAQREATRCTEGNMTRALAVSEAEGCFSVNPESRSCACGGQR
jgi:hypothetical protein